MTHSLRPTAHRYWLILTVIILVIIGLYGLLFGFSWVDLTAESATCPVQPLCYSTEECEHVPACRTGVCSSLCKGNCNHS